MKVAVTTTHDSCVRVERPLRDVGLEPVRLPCISIQAADDAILSRTRRDAAAADWLLLTSARTVSVLWPDTPMPPVAVAAVGPATAQAAAEAGGRVEVIGDGAGAELGRKLHDRVAGRRVVFPHGALADAATARSMHVAGAEVQAISVYETLPIPPKDTPVDAAIFGSASAVAGWCLSRGLDGIVLAAIGPTTAATLEDLSHPPHVIPDHPSYEKLANALARRANERSRI